jgi:hypothetical protein
MANAQTLNPWRIDTCGVLSAGHVVVKKATIIPNAAGDAAVLVTWDTSATKKATQTNKTVTVTSSKTITSTASDFEAAEVTAGDIIKITNSSSGNNLGTFIVDARGGDDNITIETGNTLTDEATKVYSWTTQTPQTAIHLLSPGTEKIAWELDFGPAGLHLPNLALQSISSSAVVYLYV